ncbi:LacI family DNA-binding transcriptional regulator [Actinoplanes derwentensis]|uniref:DNA-binding transcriptional regulator, LacI/PurR family n=1 Tax=Actinoplanes derwentensis TaxID=113562 RepID=A0A1H2AF34_9ACTN|nr:LacI family DNA-binding transcriptional regulator [Actinoplanes derwentensis]GID88235.1 LacI family transcriptional regulator [Actinoplanes derwentensis]SDT44362.1 DNA-binding transcriptional regulator, LacI/PurR family [Actinoplanes derwentensis]
MPTINDVAKAAGVSPSTVSYVLSGRRPISAETRARVQAAIAELGFHPHAGARALASSKTNVIALVAPLRVDVNVPVIMQFATAVVTAARSYNHDVLLLTKDEGTAGLERVAHSTMVDALILMDLERDDLRIPALRRLKQPSVLIGLPADHTGIACVDLDFGAAAREALSHLAGHGHRRIGLVGPSPAVYKRQTTYADRFLTGFLDASVDLGLRTVTHPCEPGAEGVRSCMADLDAELDGITALVVHNEEALRPLLDLLHATGRRIPEDISVVAVCPRDVATAMPVALTSIDIPAHDVGTLAVETAMRLLDGRSVEYTRLLAPSLVERDSCREISASHR